MLSGQRHLARLEVAHTRTRAEIGDESHSPDKKVRVVTTISYRLR